MIYNVLLSKEAVKTLDRVDSSLERRIRQCLNNLRVEPDGQGKLLKGMEGLHSICVGDWRVIYTVQSDPPVVYILAIRPRGKAYRNM